MEVVAENQINISDALFFQSGVDCVSVSVTMTVSEFILIHASSKHSWKLKYQEGYSLNELFMIRWWRKYSGHVEQWVNTLPTE